jgi:ABC-2 type transport system ATP-binding protein
MKPPVIETRALEHRFGKTKALAPIDLEMHSGSALALLGRNGSGKSTLIRILMGFLSPSHGEARVFGTNPRKMPESIRAMVGYIADTQDLPGYLTVADYLAYLRPLYPTWDRAFEERLIRLFDVPLDRKLRHVSRGQRVKAAFVGALSFRPKLLFMDEPFSGLDPAVRDEVLDALLEIMNHDEWTFVISSHEIDEVERLADQVIIMDAGVSCLREEKDMLLERCRLVSLHSAASCVPASLPLHWWNPQAGEGRVTFLDSAHHEERLRTDIGVHFPDARHVSAEPAPLKAIVRALLRNND